MLIYIGLRKKRKISYISIQKIYKGLEEKYYKFIKIYKRLIELYNKRQTNNNLTQNKELDNKQYRTIYNFKKLNRI